MPQCLLQSTPYKGLFILILIFVVLEYIFNTISETRNGIFNTTAPLQYFDKTQVNSGPLLKSLLLKNYSGNLSASSTATNIRPRQLNPVLYSKAFNISLDISNLNYLITIPPLLNGSITSTYTTFHSTTLAASLDHFTANNVSQMPSNTSKPLCPEISQYLHGRVSVQTYPVPSIQELEKRFGWLKPGGHWAPPECRVEKKVAIVVPYRGRGEHLLLFLQHIHPFLRRQQLDYTIFLVEQEGNGPFNRATLMNVGYNEALKIRPFDCFIFHDVDLLPEDDRNLYNCPLQPRHMSVAVDVLNYKLPYPAIFGGVSAISTEHFKLLNGFSNSFWGWGGEDDDMSNRIRYHHLYISRYPITIARYTMLSHKKDFPNPNRYEILRKKQFAKDGLSSLKYELLMKKEHLLYTWMLVKLTPPKGR